MRADASRADFGARVTDKDPLIVGQLSACQTVRAQPDSRRGSGGREFGVGQKWSNVRTCRVTTWLCFDSHSRHTPLRSSIFEELVPKPGCAARPRTRARARWLRTGLI